MFNPYESISPQPQPTCTCKVCERLRKKIAYEEIYDVLDRLFELQCVGEWKPTQIVEVLSEFLVEMEFNKTLQVSKMPKQILVALVQHLEKKGLPTPNAT